MFRPDADRVVVKLDKEEETRLGSIIVAPGTRKTILLRGTITQTGPDVKRRKVGERAILVHVVGVALGAIELHDLEEMRDSKVVKEDEILLYEPANEHEERMLLKARAEAEAKKSIEEDRARMVANGGRA